MIKKSRTILLLVLVLLLTVFAANRFLSLRSAKADYASDAAVLASLQERIEEKKSELADLKKAAESLTAAVTDIQEQSGKQEGTNRDISEEIESLTAQISALQEKLAAINEEKSYNWEVYHALKDGYEKVLGYLSGN